RARDLAGLAAAFVDALVAALSTHPVLQGNQALTAPLPLWLSLTAARTYSGLPRAYLRERCAAGQIEAFRRGRRWWIRRASIEEYTVRALQGGVKNASVRVKDSHAPNDQAT